MTKRVLARVHGELAHARYREMFNAGDRRDDLSGRALHQTHGLASAAYWQLPPWRRWLGRGPR